jgi:predicted RNA binding protein YcfA (HicA-like mRNA interferase family)
MKVREVIKRIEADGWVFARYGGRSSHRIYKKTGTQAEIAISGIGSDEISPGQLQSVRRKSGLPLR